MPKMPQEIAPKGTPLRLVFVLKQLLRKHQLQTQINTAPRKSLRPVGSNSNSSSNFAMTQAVKRSASFLSVMTMVDTVRIIPSYKLVDATPESLPPNEWLSGHW